MAKLYQAMLQVGYESVKKGKWEGETAFIRKDGSEFSARIKITPTKDKNGEHIGYCGVTLSLIHI